MIEIDIQKEPIELNKLLKLSGLAPSGGAAKHIIAEGCVTVNGKVETRKRNKIFAKDVVSFSGETICVRLLAETEAEGS